jgi:hypothetical protein
VYSGSSANSQPTVSNNVIKSGFSDNSGTFDVALECSGYASIINNVLSSCETGIRVNPYKGASGFPLIEKNLVINDKTGIEIRSPNDPSFGSTTPLIQENLITNNTNGIVIEHGNPAPPEIVNNNIYSNDINLYLGVPYDINATNNWWGTTDTLAINQSIYDFKNDFNLGIVNFVPFLTEPNPQTMPNPSLSPSPPPTASPIPPQSPNPTPTPNSTSSIPEFPSWLILPLLAMASAFLVNLKKKVKA